MDRIAQYRAAIKKVLTDLAAINPSTETVRTELVFDDERGHYHLGEVGWEGKRYVDAMIVHIDIVDGRVWLQFNGTDLLIGDELIEAGVPRDQIVLGFQPPSVRPFTAFAA